MFAYLMRWWGSRESGTKAAMILVLASILLLAGVIIGDAIYHQDVIGPVTQITKSDDELHIAVEGDDRIFVVASDKEWKWIERKNSPVTRANEIQVGDSVVFKIKRHERGIVRPRFVWKFDR